MVSNQQIKRTLELKKQGIKSKNFLCSHCGTENETHATYCMECGEKMGETVNKDKEPKQQKLTAEEFLRKREKEEIKQAKSLDEFKTHQIKLVSFEETEKGAIYSFTGTDENNLAARVNSLLIAEGYKLESGSILSGDYGTGSHALRLIGGVLVKRFKFYVNISSQDEKTILEFSKAMSGFSGGILRVSEMTKEFGRLKSLLKSI